MAKSKTPAVRHLRYEITNSNIPGTETSHYVDIARDLSAINRRMMEQGRLYHIGKITVVSRNTIAAPGGSAGFISVAAAPTSWSVIGAVKNAKKAFKDMQKKASKSIDIRPGRYNDFRIRGLHAGTVAPTYLVPQDNGGNSLQFGEWSYSEFVSPDGTASADAMFSHILGAHSGGAGLRVSVGLVESFGNTRSTVSDSTPATIQDSDDPLANLFDDGTTTDEVLDDMTFNYDQPPYDVDEYGGSAGNMPRPLVMSHATLGADGRCTLSGFAAVHGLIEFEATSPIADDVYSILVELKSGPYKGIAAEAL